MMMMMMRQSSIMALVAIAIALVIVMPLSWTSVVQAAAKPSYGNKQFSTGFYVNWKPAFAKLANRGKVMNLKLDNTSGSGFQSKKKYQFGFTSMKIQLVPKNASGVVVAYYMMSLPMANRNEFDFEFLGNRSGEPWICQTNIYTNGTGGREERIYLWFDPSKEPHTYSILWNNHQIVFYVDDYPIRVYRNNNITSHLYPNNQGMTLYNSIWNGESWATRCGKDKIDWSCAPFVASYSLFALDGCTFGSKSCLKSTNKFWWDQQAAWTLTTKEQSMYTWVRSNYMVYDYCKDSRRYPVTPYDCASPPW